MSRRRRILLSSTAVNVVLNGELPLYATFTRASSGTYFDSAGVLQTATTNEARNHYLQDGSGLNGLLIEEARTNSCLQSEDLSTTWAANATTVTVNQAAAPDGATTMDELVSNEVATSHFISQAVSITNTTTYTWSTFAKASTSNFIQITTSSALFGSAVWANFDLSSGVVGSLGASCTSTILHVGNGVYRCTMTATATGTGSIAGFALALVATASSGRIAVFNSAASVFTWGSQLEVGAFATSYIATTTVAATRAADVATINVVAVSWFNATEGTIYADTTLIAATTFSPFAAINDGTTANRIVMFTPTSTAVQGLVTASSVDVAAPTVTGVVTTNRTESALGYKVNDYNIAVNGGLGTLDTSGALPSGFTQLNIGRSSSGVSFLNGIISNLRYYNTRLSDANLQVLTT